MTQPEIQSFISRALAVQAETQEGVDPGITSAANAFDIFDGKAFTEHDKIDRKRDRPFFGGDAFVITNERGGIEGGVELIPPPIPGVDSPPVGTVLLPCGMKVTKDAAARTTVYTPISKDIPTVIAAWWHAGTTRVHAGCRGNLSGITLKINDRFMAQLRLLGSFTGVGEEALPEDCNYSQFLTPTVVTAENSVLLLSLVDASITNLHILGKELTLDLSNVLAAEQFTELRRNRVSDRQPTFKALFARTSDEDFGPWRERSLHKFVTFKFTLTEPDGRTSWLYIRGQMETIEEVDVDGNYLWQIGGPCVPSDAGGDEFAIGFGDTSFALVGSMPDQRDGAYSEGFTIAGGAIYTAPVVYTSTGDLPDGCTLNASTGVVSGTAVAGTYTGTIVATDDDGRIATKAFTIEITFFELDGDMPDQAAGAYSEGFTILAGSTYTAPVVYTSTGSLPAGCTLDPDTGVVSGTATSGSYTGTIVATDDDGQIATKAFDITIT